MSAKNECFQPDAKSGGVFKFSEISAKNQTNVKCYLFELSVEIYMSTFQEHFFRDFGENM